MFQGWQKNGQYWPGRWSILVNWSKSQIGLCKLIKDPIWNLKKKQKNCSGSLLSHMMSTLCREETVFYIIKLCNIKYKYNIIFWIRPCHRPSTGSSLALGASIKYEYTRYNSVQPWGLKFDMVDWESMCHSGVMYCLH
jgi:hypothetical protein